MAEWIEELTWIPKLSGWSFIKPIKITERSGNNLSDYQVLIELNSSNFDFSKAKSDGSDIRFLLPSGKSIPYWIESWDKSGQSAKVWVKVPSIPANSSTVIYMYYGNPSATDESNGDAVFEFFDDFEGTSLDTSKWDGPYESGHPGRGSYSVQDSYIALRNAPDGQCGPDYGDNDIYIKTKQTFSPEIQVIMKIISDTAEGTDWNSRTTIDWFATDGSQKTVQYFHQTDEWIIHTTSGANTTSGTFQAPVIYVAKFFNDRSEFHPNRELILTSDAIMGNDKTFEISCRYTCGHEIKVDWFAVAKLTDPEPSLTVGSEIWL